MSVKENSRRRSFFGILFVFACLTALFLNFSSKDWMVVDKVRIVAEISIA